MNSPYYPIFLNAKFLACLVVGGGTVAQRKIETLLESGAAVTVVSPDVTDRLDDMAKQGRIEWFAERYDERFLQGKNLVIGATDDTGVNERIFLDAKKAGIPVNIVDDPEHCTFIVPSVLAKGPLVVAVSTGGAAPKLAAKIRGELETLIPDEYAVMIAKLQALRPAIKRLPADKKENFWQTIYALEIGPYTGKPEQLRAYVEALLQRFSGQDK
ncbi:MAG: bifunctional precorrin-2 dehydrogenase/sirohydrochlorin ferrochelatase [Chitinivibrionales bacterium]|nr:bifunctional precorrin-2 dehydrogenase/sirohydrochlorin ferrochelatase [Chitinivibrionales bacterium]